jgi:hypothetical protein
VNYTNIHRSSGITGAARHGDFNHDLNQYWMWFIESRLQSKRAFNNYSNHDVVLPFHGEIQMYVLAHLAIEKTVEQSYKQTLHKT